MYTVTLYTETGIDEGTALTLEEAMWAVKRHCKGVETEMIAKINTVEFWTKAPQGISVVMAEIKFPYGG